MFIKRGDNKEGKILAVVEDAELTDLQKKTAKKLANTPTTEPVVQKPESK
jgi:hypothetical protein